MNTGGLVSWIQENIIPVLILVIGASILLLANKGNVSKIVTVVAGVLIGLIVIALSATGASAAFGSWLLGLFGIGR